MTEPTAGDTKNEKLRALHGRWHEKPGELIGADACGYESCQFWYAAEFTLRLSRSRND